MAQSPIRRPVSQVEDFKARFGVVQGQRGSDPRYGEPANHGSSGGGFSSRQMLAAIVLAMVAGMSGAAVFWFAQDFGVQQQTASKTAVSAPQEETADQPAPTQMSSLRKSSDADSPVLPSGGTEEIAGAAPAPSAEKSIQDSLPQPQAAQTPPLATEAAAEPAPQQPPAAESPAPPQVAKVPEPAPAEPEVASQQPDAAPSEQQPAVQPAAEAPQPEDQAPSPAEGGEEQMAVAAPPAAEPAPEPEAAAPAEPATQAESVPAIAPGQVWTDCEGCPEMVAVIVPKANGGGMKFAAENEASGLQPFAIGRFEITFDGWGRCVAAGACQEMPSDGGWGAGTRPVINVSHHMIAQQYLPWLSNVTGKEYRLPTSQEWDLAEGGLNGGSPAWTAQALCASANFAAAAPCEDPFPETAPVGSYRPNAIGLQDMRGNVWEWVSDCWTPGFNYKAKPSERDCRKRLVRGGSWSSQPALSAVAPKGFEDQMRISRSIGFRVARSLP